MATTSTMNTLESVAQAKRIIDAGGEMVRFTTQGRREAENMKNISEALRRDGYDVPLVADVHFNANVADVAVKWCEKVRINPGNYVRDGEEMDGRFTSFLRLCKQYGRAIRIGVNHGSLSERIKRLYGDTEEGIVESCMEFLRICRREDFRDVVLSVKASNTVVMVRSVRRLVRTMEREGMAYPLHLGVTEAGEGEDGRVKSAVGIGALLTEGVGDTIRVSLTEEPEREIPVARKMVEYVGKCTRMREEARIDNGLLSLDFSEDDREDLMLKAGMTAGALLIDGRAKDLEVRNHGQKDIELADAIMQAARLRFTKTEYISCPGCGRTLYDLRTTMAKIKSAIGNEAERDPRLKSLKIGVMGCIVNGPGEMADADYGYVGAGPHRVALYKGREKVETNIPEEEAVEKLLNLIRTTLT